MRIEHYEFGEYIIDGRTYRGDIKIMNNKISFWRNHNLGLYDIIDLVGSKPEIIIIGTGYSGVIDVSDEIKKFIESKSIRLIIKKTKEACEEFNNLNKQRKVAAILHGTC